MAFALGFVTACPIQPRTHPKAFLGLKKAEALSHASAIAHVVNYSSCDIMSTEQKVVFACVLNKIY